MNAFWKILTLIGLFASVGLAGARGFSLSPASPALTIWSWDYPQDLSFIGNKQFDTAESGIKRALEIDCSATVAKSSAPYFKIDAQLSRLLSVYQQNHLYEKAVALQQFIFDSYKASGVKNDGVIALAQAELANLRLLSAERTQPSAGWTSASDEQFRQAISKIADFYGPDSGEFKSAMSRRISLLQSVGGEAAAAALSKEHL